MIRFIDLTEQILTYPDKDDFVFAFFNTVPDRFISIDGDQTWSRVEGFERDFLTGRILEGMDIPLHRRAESLERFVGLIPDKFKSGDCRTIGQKIEAIVAEGPCDASALSIERNDHITYNQSLEETLDAIEDDAFANSDERARCLDKKELWSVFYHPHGSVGFFRCYASSLEIALDAIITSLKEDKS